MFAEVVLPLAVPGTFTYLVSDVFKEKVQPGVRVLVSFGNGKKLYAGVIYSLSKVYNGKPSASTLSSVIQVLDEDPVIPPQLFKLLEWMTEYYSCTLGETIRAALPTGLTIENLTYVKRGSIVPEEISSEQPNNLLFLQQPVSHKSLLTRCYQLLMESEPINSAEFSEILGARHFKKYLREWAENGYIQLVEEPVFRYKPKIKRTLSLATPYTDLPVLSTLIDSLRGHKQELVLKLLYQAFLKKEKPTIHWVCEQANCSESVVKSLLNKQLIIQQTEIVSRLSELDAKEPQYQLQEKQKQVVQQIYKSWSSSPTKPILLMGVTGSGKTYVYMELIREQLKLGNQCLYILPEISLTEHILFRLKQNFGNQMIVYHSRMHSNEKVEIWNSVRAGEFPIVIGVRSAIFLPFQKLGLIIIDEEHDSSFKQHDDAPRYHGKDAALVLSKIWNTKVVLGSATPSFESYYAATEAKFTLLQLPNKAINQQPVVWKIIDMRHQLLHKLSVGIFSSVLIDAIKQALNNQEQIILFLNRRGYAPVLQCRSCGYTPVCPHCDVSLTAHLHSYQLTCHYCGYTNPYSQRCPKCQKNSLQDIGYGTEKVETLLQELFPDAKTARMDSDTVSNTLDLNTLMRNFTKKEIDILVGTQMVTKGLDFENVTVAGILDADRLLFQPDFRALEYTFALMTQLAGRTGRHQKNGTIFVQTKSPEHPVFQLITQSIEHFFSTELETRKKYLYPPYVRLIRIEVKHKDIQILTQSVENLQKLLNPVFGEYLFGPATPPIARIQDYYRQYFLLKIPNSVSPNIPKKHLNQILATFHPKQDNLKIIIDVDPR